MQCTMWIVSCVGKDGHDFLIEDTNLVRVDKQKHSQVDRVYRWANSKQRIKLPDERRQMVTTRDDAGLGNCTIQSLPGICVAHITFL